MHRSGIYLHGMNRLVAFMAIVVATSASALAAPSGLPSGFFTGPPVARPALTLRAFTAGVTPGFPATAVAWDLARGANGTMWFLDGHWSVIQRRFHR